ncbi:hypothetical protein, partial [Mediterraneibacter glycyrrhizinilyticus]|uniref:hypothetical protein n=1 Tax=Mediterraneibacter glycyrrhizinilyticus TaxID=342942 RepID=UPI0019617CC0
QFSHQKYTVLDRYDVLINGITPSLSVFQSVTNKNWKSALNSEHETCSSAVRQDRTSSARDIPQDISMI